jgi:hypothetical protein
MTWAIGLRVTEGVMLVERKTGGTSHIDALDRVLDKGIVIDAWVRVSLVGIDLVTMEARVMVASLDTYLQSSAALPEIGIGSRPTEAPSSMWSALPRDGSRLNGCHP